MQVATSAGTYDPYLPRVLLERVGTGEDLSYRSLEGTIVFVDISGFTSLSEKLARRGPEGAEALVYAINACFSALLADAWRRGGSLLKFGGDALLVWFEGEDHVARACSAASHMRAALRRVSFQEGLRLRMSVGVHSGAFDTFVVGRSHREFLITGPGITRITEMESFAQAGQILLSPETAALLPRSGRGASCGPGVLLGRAPAVRELEVEPALPGPGDEIVSAYVPAALRAHLAGAPGDAEHRASTVAFLQFGGVDGLLAGAGGEGAVLPLERLMAAIQDACDYYEVCFLASDVTADGGKVILSAGAPRAMGDDEERMLLALRRIVDAPLDLPLRVGVNRGRAFAGEIGPGFRRTYTVMGDIVNLAARLMASAPWGSILAGRAVIERSATSFELEPVPPFMVKGKSKPVEAVAVGPSHRALPSPAARPAAPLVGRETEVELLRVVVERAVGGQGGFLSILGDVGSGKSRLLREAREMAGGARFVHLVCQSYTQATAYATARDGLLQILDLTWDAAPGEILARVREEIAAVDPTLAEWLPLIADVLHVAATETEPVGDLADSGRQAKLTEVMGRLLARQFGRPTLIEVEFAHYMDDASAALLASLLPRLRESSTLVILTRHAGPSGLQPPSESPLLELGPLSEQQLMEIAELNPAAERLPPHVLELSVRRADGSPEFLLDLLAAAAGGSRELPDTIAGGAAARIDALDPSDRAIVRRASVLGVAFRPEHLSEILDRGGEELDEATWRRLETIFARDPDGSVRFKRPLVRNVAYQGLPFSTRRELHARAAQRLERDPAAADPAILSLHFLLGRKPESAWIYARIAAREDAARAAHADAARLWRRALEAGKGLGVAGQELAEVWEQLGIALHKAGELEAAAAAIAAARRSAPDDAVLRARLLYRHMMIADNASRLKIVVRWANRGLRELEGLDAQAAGVWRARILARLAFARIRQGRPREAERLCLEVIEQAERIEELEAQAYALWVLDIALFEQGRMAEMRYSQRSLEIYRELRDVEQEGNVLTNLAIFAHASWRWDEALELFTRALQLRARAGVQHEVARAEMNIGELLMNRGQLEEAERHLRRAARIRGSIGNADVAHPELLLGYLTARGGQVEAGLSQIRACIKRLRELGEHTYASLGETMLVEAEAFVGDPRSALAMTEGPAMSESGAAPVMRRAAAVARARLGEQGVARAVEEAIAVARSYGMLFDLAAALDLSERLLGHDLERARERDEILNRLSVRSLPVPDPTPGLGVALAR